MSKEELDRLAHGLAFESAVSIIETNCCHVDGVDRVASDFFDVSDEGTEFDARENVEECVLYLDARGLIERHPDHAHFVTVRDESEATA